MHDDLHFPGIYAIEHVASGKRYVGQAVDIQKRWIRHKWELSRGRHGNHHLQRAWSKYGAEAFTFLVLCDLSDIGASELAAALNDLELYYLRKAANPYNLNVAGEAGFSLAAETKEKLSTIRKGLWADPVFRERTLASMNMVAADPEFQTRRGAAISAALQKPDAKAKRSQNALAMWANPERRDRLSAREKANWQDPEYRARQSASRRAAAADPEVRAKRAAGIKAAHAARKAAGLPWKRSSS